MGLSPFFINQIENRTTESNDRPLTAVRIIGVRKSAFIVSDGETELLVTISGSLLYAAENGGVFPVTGDWVLIRENRIVDVLERRNVLSRGASGARASGREGAMKGQVIAANIDTVFIVCGLDRDYNPRRIERYITLVYNNGLTPVVVLTKSDLQDAPEAFLEEIETIAFGIPVSLVSAVNGTGRDALMAWLAPGQTVAMLGSSGAGKSTLLNLLAGKEIRKTGAVSDYDGKGVHTTTTRDLFLLPEGGMIIDNPGIREIAFWEDTTGPDAAFPEIQALIPQCRFADCSHTHEPGCAVLQAVIEGTLPSERLESYQKMKREFDYLSQRESKSADRVEKERWKEISVFQKKLKKSNRKR